jgi:hypothetical protein
MENGPITVVALSMAWTVFAVANIWVIDSNRALGMGVCMRLFCLYCKYTMQWPVHVFFYLIIAFLQSTQDT